MATSTLLLAAAALLLCGSRAANPCWQYHYASPFLGPPDLEEVSGGVVRVSWKDALRTPHCVDSFAVEYWSKAGMFTDAKKTSPLAVDTYSVDVPVEAGVPYKYRVIGNQGRVEKFHTANVEFATAGVRSPGRQAGWGAAAAVLAAAAVHYAL